MWPFTFIFIHTVFKPSNAKLILFSCDQAKPAKHCKLETNFEMKITILIFIAFTFTFVSAPNGSKKSSTSSMSFETFARIRNLSVEIFSFWYFEVVFHWRSSSLRAFWIVVWSSELEFKIWRWSDQCLLRYSTINILRSSSVGGCLHFKHRYFGLIPWS